MAAPVLPDPITALRLALVGVVEAVRPVRRMTRPTVVPGVGRVQRFKGEPALPLGVRARLPRGLLGPLRTGTGAALVAGALLLGGAALAIGAHRGDASRIGDASAAVDAAVAAAAADPVAAAAVIVEADAVLAAEGWAATTPAELGDRIAAFEDARDRSWGLERLGAPRRVGILPESLRGGHARLVAFGDRVFLAGVGLYELDLERGRLVAVLAEGDLVVGGSAGRIVDGVADGQGIAVSDGAAIYRQARDGRWASTPLTADEGGVRPQPGQTAGFNGQLYALAPDGRIVRYDDDGDKLVPATWAGPADHPDLVAAQDLVVNGRIHVLLDDGRVLVFYHGMLEAANGVPVMPMLGGDAFFGEAPDSRALYLVEPGFRAGTVTGRVVRFDAGGVTQQFAAPAARVGDQDSAVAASALGRARALAVLEEAGKIVFLSGDEVWQADLPPLIGA